MLPGRILRRIGRRNWNTMPWKNGGGTTHELWREGEGREGWALRLSLAEVRAAGPFSRFPGIDRVILLAQGRGFVLQREDGLEVPLASVARPFAFLGEDSWHCRLVDGPVLDFNVMTDRRLRSAAVWRQESGWVGDGYFLSLEDGNVGGETVEALELLQVEGWLETTGPGVMVRVRPAG